MRTTMKAKTFAATLLLQGPGLAPCSADKAGVAGTCSLYLAKSTIENSGLGMFAGVSFEGGEHLGFGDIAIPIVDMDFHAGGSSKKKDFHWLLKEYQWTPGNMGEGGVRGYEMKLEADETSGFALGFGSMANCHHNERLRNVVETEMVHDAAGIHGGEDPGAGAFTPYHNRSAYAATGISAGAELFVDYGTNWFMGREKYMGLTPLPGSYQTANKFVESAGKLVGKISRRYRRHHRTSSRSTARPRRGGREISEAPLEAAVSDLWDIIREHPYESRPLRAIPGTLPAAKRAVEVGIEETEVEQSTRSPEYLASHGRCLDYIRPGKSTIPHAGRGAFATRRIPKGGYISIAPLIHIPDRDTLTMYRDTYDPATGEVLMNASHPSGVRDLSNPIGHQLLLNYCFGHGASSLLLCPYATGAALVNHGASPNAKIVWSADPYHDASLMEEPVSYFESTWTSRMAIEYVATRDIDEGEEILIDYGPEWEQAWSDYMRRWTAPAALQITPHMLNQNETRPVPTHDEDHTLLAFSGSAWCRFSESLMTEGEHWWREVATMKDYAVRRIVDRSRPAPGEPYVYAVELDPGAYLVANVPREALSFYGRKYQSDMFLEGVFRHEMMIPDEMFPITWKNL